VDCCGEQLLSLSDTERALTYNILVSPMPVANYVAGMRFTPITKGDSTFAEWWAEFDVTQGPEADTVATSATTFSSPASLL
jgi:hypothetical protein